MRPSSDIQSESWQLPKEASFTQIWTCFREALIKPAFLRTELMKAFPERDFFPRTAD
jgi:hypothetical protein